MGFRPKNDKEAAQEYKHGRAGRMGDLKLVTTGDELAAVPEAAGGFHGHHKNGTGDHTHDPSHHIVHSIKPHIELAFFGMDKYKEVGGEMLNVKF